jgi:hypothetical protein
MLDDVLNVFQELAARQHPAQIIRISFASLAKRRSALLAEIENQHAVSMSEDAQEVRRCELVVQLSYRSRQIRVTLS